MNNTSPIPLSCYIRTLNEEARIGPVVEKVIEIGAEVVVIDSGSTDRTKEIAEAKGAKIIEQKWLGNGFQKRVGEEAVQHDWILDLDADEVLSSELQQEILKLFSHGAPEPGIFTLKQITVPPVPKGFIWKNFGVILRNKLYNKSIVRIPEHAAWDQFEVPPNITPKKLNGALLHYAFRDIAQQVGKVNQGSSVRAKEAKLKPKWLLTLRILFGYPVYLLKPLFAHQLYRAGIYGIACAAVIASNRWLKDVKMYEFHLLKNGRNEITEN